jgi:hypothetical protein
MLEEKFKLMEVLVDHLNAKIKVPGGKSRRNS